MLDRIPPEILERIVLLCDPIDIASLSRLNKLIHQHIRHNNNLWQKIFLSHFDDPCTPEIRSAFESHSSTIKYGHPHTQIDWRSTLVARITLRKILGTTEHELFIHRLHNSDKIWLCQLALLIIYTARSPSYSSCTAYSDANLTYSLNLKFLHGLLSNPIAQLHLFHLSDIHPPDHVPPCRVYRDMLCPMAPAGMAPAKLHTLFGLTGLDLESPRSRGLARERSYGLWNYSRDNLYGPFVPFEGTLVNWYHLRDLGLVVSLNLYGINRRAQQRGSSANPNYPTLPNLPVDPPPFTMPNTPGYLHQNNWPHPNLLQDLYHPLNLHDHHQNPNQDTEPEEINWPILNSLQSAIPFSQVTHPSYSCPALVWPPSSNFDGHENLNHYDWAGVTGKWLRMVCFLDYRDFQAYNLGTLSLPTLDNQVESVRLMTLDLQVVSIRDPPNDTHPIPVGLRTDLWHRPPIFFKGTLTYNAGARSAPIVGQSVSTLRGCVSMTIDDEVRWSMVSTLGGTDRWASEGIQVGGVRSKWGVLGVWTDVNRDDLAEPVGPFYFFKASC